MQVWLVDTQCRNKTVGLLIIQTLNLNTNSVSYTHLDVYKRQALGFPKPLHPLVSLVNYADIKTPYEELPKALLLNFYKISYKKSLTGKIKYGQNYYDFDEGGLSFISPNQVISSAEAVSYTHLKVYKRQFYRYSRV